MTPPGTPAIRRFLLLLLCCTALFLGRGVVSDGYYDSANLLLGFFPWRSELPMPAPADMNPLLTDHPTQFLLWHRFAAEEIRAGRLPLWNPWSGAGRPLLANSQSAVFSPANVGHYLLGERAGLLWAAAWRYFCAGLGMWVLARRMQCSEAAAAFAAIAFAFCGPMVVWQGHPQSAVFATLPWLLAAAHALVRTPGPRAAAGLSLALALAFVSGHPESTFHVVICAVLWAVWLLLRRGAAVAATVKWTIVGVVAGVLLASAHVAPFLEYLAHSDAWAIRQAAEGHASVAAPLASVAAWVLPNLFGHPHAGAFAFPVVNYHDITAYAGMLVPLLAVLGVARRVLSYDTCGLLCVGVFAALAVYGIPPVNWLLGTLPLFRSAYNNRLLVVAVCAVVLAAAAALDQWDRIAPPRRAALGGFIAGLLLIVVGWVLSRSASGALASGPAFVRAGAVLSGTAVVLLSPWRVWGMVLVVALDLLSWGYRYNPVTPPEQHYPTTPFIARLQEELRDNPQRRMLARGYVFPSETPIRYGMRDLKAWDAVEPARYARYMDIARETGRGAGPEVRPTTRLALYRAYRSPLLNAAAAAVVLSEEPLHDPGFESLVTAPGIFAYRNTRALPRARLAQRVEVLPSAAAVAERLATRGHDPARVTLVEGVQDVPPTGGTGTVVFVLDAPTHVRLQVEADGPAMVVLADVMFPGWEATVDGVPTPIWYADLAFRAVPVPAGRHVVAFRYRPRSVRVGLLLTMLGVCGVVAMAIYGPRRGPFSTADAAK